MHPIRLNVLIVHDEKPGHLSQLTGLCLALEKLANVETQRLAAKPSKSSLKLDATPQIVIGAGHATHTTILRIASKYKAFSVVLMKPSIPYYFFDAIICPQHDKIKNSQRVFKTIGTINKVRQDLDSHNRRSRHLILLGGPSKNYQWDEAKLLEQITEIGRCSLKTEWLLIPSRRTPASILDKIKKLALPNLTDIPADDLNSPLEKLLLNSRMVWVTPDSQSMLYEALTAGTPTGIFDLSLIKRKKSLRIEQQTQKLVNDKLATNFSEWSNRQSSQLPPAESLTYPSSPAYFCEADNAAKWLLDRYRNKIEKKKNNFPNGDTNK